MVAPEHSLRMVSLAGAGGHRASGADVRKPGLDPEAPGPPPGPDSGLGFRASWSTASSPACRLCHLFCAGCPGNHSQHLLLEARGLVLGDSTQTTRAVGLGAFRNFRGERADC